MLTCWDHPSEESLERYALGGLPVDETEQLEAHLLVCAACQDLLTEVDLYVQAVRDAAIQLSHEQHWTWRQRLAAMLDVFMARRLVWAAGALLLAAGLTWMTVVRVPSRPGVSAPLAVALRTLRGAADSSTARVPSGRALLLEADLAGLPQHNAWELRLVDSYGRPVRTSHAESEGTLVIVPVPKGLGKGAYWVRLYARSAPNQLMREYALQVE
jgi:hypothetical protein